MKLEVVNIHEEVAQETEELIAMTEEEIEQVAGGEFGEQVYVSGVGFEDCW